jgi:crotonobetainyl-CoA:carnitine CoA-transferase CaiB-like acyl-CoA transferase
VVAKHHKLKEASMGPLEGLKVIDLSRVIAGPYCSMLLGDLGADIIKIEKPGGEGTRSLEPTAGGDSSFFMVFNRNKRGMTLNFRNEKGQETLRKLIAKADILLENFRPGTMEKMGCSWEVLHELNPKLIMARVSGYGHEGPKSDRVAVDPVVQAASGLMSMTGQKDGPPTMMGVTVVDHVTALYATIAITSALQVRHSSGKGQLVRVNLMDSALSLLQTSIPDFQLFGKQAGRIGAADRFGAPVNSYETGDGRAIQIAAGGAAFYPRFLEAISMSHLGSDPRFNTGPDRMENAEALDAEIRPWMKARSANEILEVMAAASVPCDIVAQISDVIEDPHLRDRDQIIEVDHPTVGKIQMQGFFARFSETEPTIRYGIPAVGQHTEEVLKEWLGYDEGKIAALRAETVI